MSTGAWEQKKNNQVLCAILSIEYTTVAWALGLRNLQIPGQITILQGMPYDHARNAAVSLCLQQGFDWLFFLDSDVIPPRDAVYKLLSRNKPIISGVYYRRSPPAGIPVMLRDSKWITEFPQNSIIEVDLVGAGCLLVNRQVFERMQPQRPGKPWFDWRVDQQGHMPPGECLSEDFTWCIAAKRQLGIPICVDTSIQCRHVGHAQALLGRMEPLSTDVNT